MPYDSLLNEAMQLGLHTIEMPMHPANKGFYADNVICINKNIETQVEKATILAEELGHHHTSSGNIIDQTNTMNRKQEKIARTWAYMRLVPVQKIVQAYEEGITSRYELADFLNVTEFFLDEALKRYQEKYGVYKRYKDYVIYFNPLNVKKE